MILFTFNRESSLGEFYAFQLGNALAESRRLLGEARYLAHPDDKRLFIGYARRSHRNAMKLYAEWKKHCVRSENFSAPSDSSSAAGAGNVTDDVTAAPAGPIPLPVGAGPLSEAV